MAVYSVGLICVCGYLSLGVSGLLNHGQVSPTVTAYSDHVWKELYTFKKQLDAIQKENQELKKNQSELFSHIKQKQNMSNISSADIQKLQDRLDGLEKENNELKINQTALYMETETQKKELKNETTMRLGMERQIRELMKNETMLRLDMKAVKKANEDLRKNQTLFCSEVTSRISKHETDFGHLNNSFKALSSVQKATASVVTALQGEEIANKLGISGLQRNLSEINTILYNQNNSIDTLDRNMKSEMRILNSSLQASLTAIKDKILFSAKMANSSASNVKNNVIQYNRVITNQGSAYNPSDSVFTVPVEGFYMFSWSITQYDRKYTDTAIVKNGAEFLKESAFVFGGSGVMDSSSQTVTIHLVTGDRIWIKYIGGSHPYIQKGDGRFEGVFTGIRL